MPISPGCETRKFPPLCVECHFAQNVTVPATVTLHALNVSDAEDVQLCVKTIFAYPPLCCGLDVSLAPKGVNSSPDWT